MNPFSTFSAHWTVLSLSTRTPFPPSAVADQELIRSEIFSIQDIGLLDSSWVPQRELIYRGLTYSTRTWNPQNSAIRFTSESTLQSLTGQIHHIFRRKCVAQTESEWLLGVRLYRPLTGDEERHNLYLDHPILDASLHHDDFLPAFIMIRPGDIQCNVVAHRYEHLHLGPVIATLPVSSTVSNRGALMIATNALYQLF